MSEMNPSELHIAPLLAPTADDVESLAAVLSDCVEGGASVSFMWPLAPARAWSFWQAVAEDVQAGRRALLVARDSDGQILGTVQLVLDQPDNQPHRADLAKMLVHRRARRLGLGARLMQAAEDLARQHGKQLLVLDTVTGGDAERLYTRLGWQRGGRDSRLRPVATGRPVQHHGVLQGPVSPENASSAERASTRTALVSADGPRGGPCGADQAASPPPVVPVVLAGAPAVPALAAASASLQEGEHTNCAFPKSRRDLSWLRGRCLPHRKHDIVAAPKAPAAVKGEPGVLLR